MIFLSVCIIFVAISIDALRKAGIQYSFSKGVSLATGISLLAVALSCPKLHSEFNTRG
jgi:hypothetical protein